MTQISLVDTTVRDGNQSLWGATALNTGMMLKIAPVMNRVGYDAIDFITSSHMAVTVRYHQENPWERIRLMRGAIPDTQLSFLTPGFRFISWQKATDEFLELSFQALIRNGIDRFMIADPMNDIDSITTTSKMINRSGCANTVAALVFTESPIHNDDYYAQKAKQLAACPEVQKVYLKDPGGLLRPERARTILPAIQAQLGDKPLELHSHCTIGLAPFSYLEAADANISALHVASTAVANGTSQPDAVNTVSNLRELGYTVDIDDDALKKVCDYFHTLALAEGLPIGQPQPYDLKLFKHQVPGGMLTTMTRQLKEIGQEHRLSEVLEEIEHVRAELGYPIMVTPFSQLVGAQAVMNVIAGERYKNMPDEVIRYAKGMFGAPPVPIDQNLMDRISSSSRAAELEAEPGMLGLDELRQKIGRQYSDEELLLRATMPQEQVDAMGACSTTYNAAATPLKSLLKGLTSRARGQVKIEKENFKLELSSRP